ncbi:MAG: glycosyltransferase [Muribaculaceae bacterium]|nr:glycosyltransferase [Roseburia sp.]MCM1429826.1 glycosyltransferase [Muribaculaceae bacterium]MCM1492877.1 glycosyltransferase [Muribaculaceae bacterium]
MENKNVKKTGAPVLSIALLASDRKDTIQKCLDSLTPVREALPCELIVVDTGCSRELRKLLEQYADVVADFVWCDDFSRARNETLKYARGEWYMYLDDDEWFVDVQELIDFFASGEYKSYGRASYIQRNFLDMEATQYTDSWVSRMTRLSHDTHFVSKIHEYMEPAEGDCKGLKAIVHHFGYVYETEEALRKHFDRNVPLLMEMIAQEPDNLRWRIQLAQEYRSVKEYDKLYALGEECLKLTAERNERNDNIALGGFYGAKVIACRERERYEEALAACGEAEKDKRNTELCRAFLALNMARAYFYLERFAEAEKKAAEYLRWKDFFTENEPVLYLQKPVPFVGECMDLVMIKEGYSLLICSGLRQGNTAYLEKYLDKLEWVSGHVYVFEEMVPTLVRAMCGLHRTPVFERTIAVMHGHAGLWEYFCSQLTEYEEAGNKVTPVMDMIRKVAPDALMGEKEVKEQSAAQGADGGQELRTLADSVKQQLRILTDAGMKEEAAAVLAQVRRLLPDDAELIALEKEIQK